MSDGGSSAAAPKNQVVKSLKLISVSFKEAALDSPSFRASINHLDSQVDNIETWLEAIIKSVRRYPLFFKEFKDFSTTFLDHLVPTFLLEGLIDQDYTVKALSTTLSGLKITWNESLKNIRIDDSLGEILLDIIRNDIKNYRAVRQRFDTTQLKYDKYLSIYTSTPKTKDPATLREDAFQLLETRKHYIHASLDLVVELTKLGRKIDQTLVKLTSTLWKNKPALSDNDFFCSLRNDISRISAWCDSYQSSIKMLEKDMNVARYQIEESAIIQFTPSANLNDHNPALINANTLADIKETSNEKHGYLFMKTMIGKPPRPIWVKRWAFIKSGIFGLLILSPSKKSVQETDKIGILLCNIRYAPNEDRRFCFELKTIETTVIFQTETLAELKSWLKVFANEKSRLLEDPENASGKLHNSSAFARYPPLLYEFASTSATTSDIQLTSNRSESHGDVVSSSHLSSFLNANKESFEKEIYNHIPQVYAPMITNSTKTAVISYAFVSPSIIPTALTANIWGSVNWGLYYLVDRSASFTAGINKERKGKPSHGSATTTATSTVSKLNDKPRIPGDIYPSYYPDYLKAFDIQMKAIFETAIDPDEFCLISMRSIWSPNSKQQLNGRTFLTAENVFFYMNSLGFVSLVKLPISTLISVESYQENNFDVLKIYDLNGQSKIKLFLDDSRLIRNKINVLIQNKVRDNPKNLENLIKELEEVENSYNEQKKKLKNNSQNKLNLITPHQLVPSIVTASKPPEGAEMRIDYRSGMSLLLEKVYSLPPKALFHVLFGDQSEILENLSIMVNIETLSPELWRSMTDDTGAEQLHRAFALPISFKGQSLGNLKISQRVESMVENQYYNFVQTSSTYVLPFSPAYEIVNRVIIYSTDSRHSKMMVYNQIKFKEPNFLLLKVPSQIHELLSLYGLRKMDRMIQKAISKIGHHGMVVKAIKLYGQLSKVEDTPEDASKLDYLDDSKVVVSPLLFVKFILHFVFVRLIRILYKIYCFIFGRFKMFVNSIKMNQVLVMFLLISIFINFFFAGKTTTSYWNTRRADNVIKAFRSSEPEMIQRAIYSKDVSDLLNSGSNYSYNSSESLCYDKFKDDSFMLNFERTMMWDHSYGDALTRESAKKMKQTYIEIGMKRNELLIQLKVLNKIEEELAAGEWRNWLLSEFRRCQLVREDILAEVAKRDNNDTTILLSGSTEILSYCKSCQKEVEFSSLI